MDRPQAVADEPRAAPRSAAELFWAFTWLSLQSFGGALAFIERMVVQQKRWLSPQEFVGLFAIGQVLPGPSGLAFCVLLGDRYFGLRGAAAALAGFVLLPAVGVISIASLFLHYQHLPQVQGALNGMGAASAGLVIMTAARMASGLRGERVAIGVAGLSFAGLAWAHLPVSAVVLGLGVASVAWAWRQLGPGGTTP